MAVWKYLLTSLAGAAAPVTAMQPALIEPAPAVIFQPGTGTSPVTRIAVRPMIECSALAQGEQAIAARYYSGEAMPPAQRLERALFASALKKYRGHFCAFGRDAGPAMIVVVDFSKHSSDPRLYRVDLRTGEGIDTPIRVAHGIGSDPDDDGYASFFSNVEESLTSSLGAALGAERYVGINGVSLRLDGLESTNSQMRARDIVVHSYVPERRRYFNAAHVASRGRPGSSEGCFVVEPDKREWILQTLENGGFIYAGFGSTRPAPKPPAAQVIFVSGTGGPPAAPVATGASASSLVSGTSVGAPGSPPTALTSQDQEAVSPQ